MDATGKALGSGGRRRPTALLIAAAWLAASSAELDAAPIRGGPALASRASRVSNPLGGPAVPPVWRAFLDKGPDGWTAYQSPALAPLTRLAVWKMLEAASTSTTLDPMLEYLMWRRDLNPARFDRNHPYLGPRLGQLLKPPPLPPPTVVPPDVPPPITPPPSLVVPEPQVPEPGGWIIAALASAWGFWRRRRSRAVPAKRDEASVW